MAPAYMLLLQTMLPILQDLLGKAAKHADAGEHDAAHDAVRAAVAVGQAAVMAGHAMLPPPPPEPPPHG